MKPLHHANWLRLALWLIALAGANRASAQECTRERDVVYGRKLGMALMMDVLKPAKPSGIGVIFLVSGGFKSGMELVQSDQFGSVVLKPFLDRGQTVFAVSHSSQPKFNVSEIVPDIHRAVRFIRVHAKDYGVDPDRLGIMGTSSGGFLALSIATAGKPGDPAAKDPVDRASSRVQAAACFCPGSDLVNYGAGQSVIDRDPIKSAAMFGVQDKPAEEQIKMLREMSPVTSVGKDTPPILIIHGDADESVPYEQTGRFVAKLAEHRVPHQLITRKNAGHKWPDMGKDDVLRAEWFDKYLQPMVEKPKAAASPVLRAEPLASSDAKGVEFFENQIRPLLADKCYQCHSRESKKAKGGLLLDSHEGLLKGGDSGKLFATGDLDHSLLIKAVRYKDEDLRMPPDDKKLTEAQVAILETWVKMGAPLPQVDVRADKIKASARTHWAFQPVRQPAIPTVRNQAWVQSPMDAFILAKLEAAGMEPSPTTDKRTLIRRATYDLIGLPPTLEEVAAFVADKSPNAFATVVDRLLESKHYGERWGRHWLDVARYASSDSPFAFTYRDYVIRAFNDDLPYDKFLIQQLAADQLDLGGDKRALAALGFLTLGRQFMNNHDTIDDRIDVVTRGTMALSVSCARCHDHKYDPIPTRDYYGLHGVFASSKTPAELPLLGIAPDPAAHAEYLQKHAALQAKLDAFLRKHEADVLKEHRSQTAQCLLLSRDPKKLAGLITEEFGLSDRKILQVGATRWMQWLETRNKESDPIFAPWFAFAALPELDFANRAKVLSAKIAANALAHPVNPLVAQAFAGEAPASLTDVAERYGKLFDAADKRWQASLQNPAESLTLAEADQEALCHVLFGKDSPGTFPTEIMPSLFPTSVLMQLGPLKGEVSRLDATHPGAPQRAMALVDSPQPKNSHVFIRGNPDRMGDEAPRQFPAILAGEKRQPFTHGSGRLDLARAIASPDNPLTARVMVNRVWLHHFGAGLVTTPDDFGLRSDPPSHPELLDYLAWRFVHDGWSLKKLHRLLMLSSTYQQKSDDHLRYETMDPENRLLSKANRRRLDFESMRDTLLFVAGNLDPAAGGRPVDLLKPRAGSYARTVYGAVDRNNLPALFRTFDFANPDLSTAQRDSTAVPQQGLFFLNSPFVMEQACAMVNRPAFQRLDAETERVRELYQRAYQRDPTAEETQRGLHFLQNTSSSTGTEEPIRKQPLTPEERYVQVLLMSNELMYVD
jgi:acetyl esterase/lipase